MPRNTTISAERAWNTWSPRPLEMVFLPLGVRLTPLAFSSSTGKATLFPSGPSLKFGRHALDGGLVEATAEHAGTHLAWRYVKPDPYRVIGAWQGVTLGEWGLRFWVNLCLSADDGSAVSFDEADGVAVVKVGHRFVALASGDAPVQVTGHESIEAAAADYEQNGYFHLKSRSLAAPCLMLRFNLEMQHDGRFAAAVADSRTLAIAGAKSALAENQTAPALPHHAGRHAGSLDAVRDVMAWNTVWDEVNGRAYTSISRNWNLAKFGGFGVWLDDQLYHGLLTSLFDRTLTRDNIAAALASATPQGNLACLITANDAWVDRTQIPVGAFVVWMIYLRTRSRDLLDLAYPTLARNHAWWWRIRDPEGLNLVSYGNSDVGEGLYKGTSFGARNESSMDNSPIHDEAVYDQATGTLTTIDVGLNSLLALDAEMLSLMAAELGDTDAAAAHAALAERTRRLIGERLWDETRGLFANRLRSGAFVKSVGPTSFYPLAAGAASPEQLESLLKHLDNPETFGGDHVIPSVTRDDPAFKDNTYWRGRVWPPLNYFVWQGLRRYGRFERASSLAEASLALFRQSWDERRLCPENYSAETGEPLDQPDTEGFYGWGGLMPLMGIAEVTDISAWTGWDVVNTGADVTLGPIETPTGRVTIMVETGRLSLRRGVEVLFSTTVQGRFSDIVWEKTGIALTLPPVGAGGGEIAFPALPTAQVALATLDGREVPFRREDGGIAIALPTSAEPARLLLHRRQG
jgi:putative isomerase